MGASSFRLEHGSEAQGFGQRIVDDHGVIALVKARGKRVGAGPVLAAAPLMLTALKAAEEELLYWELQCGDRRTTAKALTLVDDAIDRAEGR